MLSDATGNAGAAKSAEENDGKALLQLGRLFLSSRQPAKALKCYERFCAAQPHDPRGPYNAAIALQQLGELQQAAEQLRICIGMEGPPQEAYEALSGVLLKLKQFDDAVALCETRIATQPSPVLFYNYNTALRQCSRISDAIHVTCDALGLQPDCAAGAATDEMPSPSLTSGDTVTVVCVKYGTKYDAEYVNILHDALRRNSSVNWRFVCFTDDASGLDEAIGVRMLPSLNWQGWWYKAYLFSQETGLSGRVLYIDLDTVVNGDVDALFQFSGRFGVLSSQKMSNENYRQGVNTSVMLWTAGDLQGIYDLLLARYDDITRVLHKFDHWVECVALAATTALNNASIAPSLEGLFIEYAEYCTSHQKPGHAHGVVVQSPPPTAAIVCFPLAPKPHHLVDKVAWVAEKWRRREREQETEEAEGTS